MNCPFCNNLLTQDTDTSQYCFNSSILPYHEVYIESNNLWYILFQDNNIFIKIGNNTNCYLNILDKDYILQHTFSIDPVAPAHAVTFAQRFLKLLPFI
jgi:hypothetical protein